jgi:RND family efflux transporter MFP subunit
LVKVIAAALLAVSIGLVVVLHMTKPEIESETASAAPQPLEIDSIRLEPMELPNVVEVSGFLWPHRSVALAMEEAGRVIAKPYEDGAHVQEGDLLLELDSALVWAELAQAAALVAEAERTRDLAGERLQRAQALMESQTISLDEFDDRQTALAVAEALLARQVAAHDLLSVRLERHRLIAPMTGTLSHLDVEIGSQVAPNIVIGQLDAVDVLEANLSVAPEVRVALSLGDEVDVRPVIASGKDHVGTITHLADVADADSRKFAVEVQVDNREGSLLGGMPVQCRLTTSVPTEGLILREEWTKRVGPSTVAYLVVRGDDAVPMILRTPLTLEPVRQWPGHVRVSAGLASGDEVAITRIAELDERLSVSPRIVSQRTPESH